MRFLRGFLAVMTLWAAGGGAARATDAAGPPQLSDVRIEQHAAAVAVTIATSGPPKYEATLLDSPVRLVIDISGTFASPRSRWTGVPEPLKEVRYSQLKPGTARLVVELNRKAGYRIEEGPEGFSLLIDAPVHAATADTSLGPRRPAGAPADLPRMPEAARPADAPTTLTASAPTEATAIEGKPLVAIAAPSTVPDATKASIALRPLESAGAPAKLPFPMLAVAKLSVSEAPKASSVSRLPQSAAAEPKPALPIPAGSTPVPTIGARPAEPARRSALPPILVAQAATTPAPGAAAPNGSKLITLEFKDADVVNLLRILSAESGRNIVAGDDVKGKLSVSLRNVTWEQALDTILEVKGLQKIDRGGVIRIISTEFLAKEREAQARADDAKRKAEIDARTKEAEAQLKEADVAKRKLQAEIASAEAQARGPLREEVIRLSYADPEEVAKTLQGILGFPEDGNQAITGTQGFSVPNGPPLIAEPPFSALYGLGLQQQQARPQVISVSQDVLANGLTIRANKATNSIFLRLYAADLDRIKKLIREYFDVPLPQVKIEARMEILDRTSLEAIGVQWGGAGAGNVGKATVVGQGFQSPVRPPGTGTFNVDPVNPNLDLGGLLPVFPGTGLPLGGNLVNLPMSALPLAGAALPAGGIAFGIIGTNWNINLALQALATLGKARTLARPEVVTVENSKAEISLGEEIPYATVSSAGTQTQFKDALLKLSVTPTVIRLPAVDGRVDTQLKMVVVVENNSRGEPVNLGAAGSPPAINKRKVETRVLLNEGERLVIGGVTQNVNQTTTRKVPFLGDIPFLGWAFKQREISELGREMVVFLTPSVLIKAAPGSAMNPK